jgi:CubicO group peptidase (beta-lactamase class C family)
MKTFAHAGRWFRLLHGALVAGLVLALTGAAETQTRPAASPVSTFTPERIDDIRQLLVDFVEGQRKSVGIVIGIVTPTHRQVMSVGHAGDNDATPLNGESVFRIASVTKVFTALLLAEMVQRRELALTDPVGTHLPIAVRIPERNGRFITLLDLVTHTSGLPPAPKDFPSLTDPSAARYSVDQLYQFLSTYELAREPGSQWQYGNLDMALLGHAMAYRAGMDYESLLRERILIPLGLADTAVTPSPGMRSRQAIGHDTQLQPITRAETPAMAAAGSMWSSTNDLMKFLAAVIGHDDSPLAPAMRAMVDVRRPMPWLGSREITVTAAQALGWFVFERGGDVIFEHVVHRAMRPPSRTIRDRKLGWLSSQMPRLLSATSHAIFCDPISFR